MSQRDGEASQTPYRGPFRQGQVLMADVQSRPPEGASEVTGEEGRGDWSHPAPLSQPA